MEKKRIALRKLLEAVEKEILRKQAIHGETSADANYK